MEQLPEDCELFCLFDCCHSGTILDLPFTIKVTPPVARKIEEVKTKTLAHPECTIFASYCRRHCEQYLTHTIVCVEQAPHAISTLDSNPSFEKKVLDGKVTPLAGLSLQIFQLPSPNCKVESIVVPQI